MSTGPRHAASEMSAAGRLLAAAGMAPPSQRPRPTGDLPTPVADRLDPTAGSLADHVPPPRNEHVELRDRPRYDDEIDLMLHRAASAIAAAVGSGADPDEVRRLVTWAVDNATRSNADDPDVRHDAGREWSAYNDVVSARKSARR